MKYYLILFIFIFISFSGYSTTCNKIHPGQELNNSVKDTTVQTKSGNQIVPSAVVDIADNKQLFFDNYIIDSLKQVFRIMNQPVKCKENPIIRLFPLQKAGGKELSPVSGSVLFDENEKVFKMWYDAEPYSWDHGYVGYAVSKDGIYWDLPDVGNIKYEGYGYNNLIFTMGAGELMPSVIKDYHEKDKYKRYKMIYRIPGEGYQGMAEAFSQDGIHWQADTARIIPFTDSPTSLLWDYSLNKYIAHTRKWESLVFADGQRYWTRIVLQNESNDFITWKEDKIILRPDDQDPQWSRQFYNMEWMPYENMYVGFVSVYHILPGMEPKCIKGPDWMDKVDIQLTFSRNGYNWSRENSRGVFLPFNCDTSKFDASMIYVMQHPVVVGDEIYIYYTGFKGHHWGNSRNEILGSAIGLAKLRLDGFVSLDAGKGIVKTKALRMKGDQLIINADASLGSLRVEALDQNGKPISGFSRENAEVFKGDEVRHVFTWNNNPNCGQLRNKPVILKFYLDHCKLYSFKFGTGN